MARGNRTPQLALTVGLLLVLAACSAGRSEPPAGAGSQGAGQALLDHELVDVVSGESFTLGELASERPVLVETMAIWCTTCLQQEREVARAHERLDFHSVGIDIDPTEQAEDLAEYAERHAFDWPFVLADGTLVRMLTDAYGFGVTNPPSTPTLVISSDGQVRALEFGRVRGADELIAELTAS